MDIGTEREPYIAEPIVDPIPVEMPERREREIELPDPAHPVHEPEKVPA